MSSARQSFYRYFLFIPLGLLLIAGCKTRESYGKWGRVESFNQLISSAKESDYSKTIIDNKADILVMAIHAGSIESGTGELAQAISKYAPVNLYLFSGLFAPDYNQEVLQSGYMHLTSHKFDDPQIIKLAQQSKLCLSLHGYPSNDHDICIGGGADSKLKQLFKDRLTSYKTCIDCCPPYLGKNPKNVVNRCQQKGIQLELSPVIRNKILNDKAFRKELAKSLFESADQLLSR